MSPIPGLPPLPPLPGKGRGTTDELNEVREKHSKIAMESVTPILSEDPDDPIQVRFTCAACGKRHAWHRHMWGSWDTDTMIPVMLRKPNGRWVRFFVPLRKKGRIGPACDRLLTNFKMSKEPAVTMNEADTKDAQEVLTKNERKAQPSSMEALLGDLTSRNIGRIADSTEEGNGRYCKWPSDTPDELASIWKLAGHIANKLAKAKDRR